VVCSGQLIIEYNTERSDDVYVADAQKRRGNFNSNFWYLVNNPGSNIKQSNAWYLVTDQTSNVNPTTCMSMVLCNDSLRDTAFSTMPSILEG